MGKERRWFSGRYNRQPAGVAPGPSPPSSSCGARSIACGSRRSKPQQPDGIRTTAPPSHRPAMSVGSQENRNAGLLTAFQSGGAKPWAARIGSFWAMKQPAPEPPCCTRSWPAPSVIALSLGRTSATCCSASMPRIRAWKKCCRIAGPPPIPMRFSIIGCKNQEPGRSAPALAGPIAAQAPAECRTGRQRPWIDMTLTMGTSNECGDRQAFARCCSHTAKYGVFGNSFSQYVMKCRPRESNTKGANLNCANRQ